MEPRPVEVTTQYSTSVPDLAAAWAFVMERIDDVGPDPAVTISPVWPMSEGVDRLFAVVVSGMTEERIA